MSRDRIIIDLTEFNTWSGHLTGVQRVVYGVARGLTGSDDSREVKYVTYGAGRAFREVSFTYADDKVNSHRAPSQEHNSDEMSNRQRAKLIAKKVYNRAPSFARSYLTPERKERLKREAIRYYSGLRSMQSTLRSAPSTLFTKEPDAVAQAEGFVFKKGDVIVSAGRAWDDEQYVERLKALKSDIGIKLAFVVYDLIPIYQQHTFGPGLTERYSKYLYEIIRAADYLLPISKSTQRDIEKYAREIGVLELPEVSTIRLGDDIAPSNNATRPWFINESAEFAMMVGTIEARKNHMEIYYAYKLAAAEGVSLPDFYVIGKPGWLTHDVIYFMQHDADIAEKIHIINNVSDGELAWMYENALFTAYPSQYEGWGLPIAESLAFGTPCIASDTSSMVEISPDLADHVSPFDTRALMDRMAHYSSPEHSAAKRAVITKQYKLYSWSESVKSLIKLVG